jgi:hypothetical protein
LAVTQEPQAGPGSGWLALIGSGETSPTMVAVHRDLVSRLGRHNPGQHGPRALLLATPYAFQENAAGVSARAQGYFARSVGLAVTVAAGTSEHADPAMAPPIQTPPALDREAAIIRDADWLFAGPGNPSYALAHWQAGPVGAALRERVLSGRGVTVLASAAAATAGEFTLPVYEIYKAGGALRWLPGLDLLGPLGLTAAVIPHYNNAEGGSYDTRYCYLGERRLHRMERQLPDAAVILGIDEHTAVLIDLAGRVVAVRGRGSLTIRRRGASVSLPSGTELPLADLTALALRSLPALPPLPASPALPSAAPSAVPSALPSAAPSAAIPLPEVMRRAQADFERARSAADTDAMVQVMLDLEEVITAWATDTEEDQGTEQARLVLRSLIRDLGRAARTGLADPADRLRPSVEPLLALRANLRVRGRYEDADAIRAALAAAGIHLNDTPDGYTWNLAAKP